MDHIQRLYMWAINWLSPTTSVNNVALYLLWLHQCILVTVSWTWDVSHHIVEDEAAVWELEVLEEAVEFTAVQSAPWTVEVISGLSLLPCVIVVEELEKKEDGYNTLWLQSGPSFKSKNSRERNVTAGLMNSSALIVISQSTEIYSGTESESQETPCTLIVNIKAWDHR